MARRRDRPGPASGSAQQGLAAPELVDALGLVVGVLDAHAAAIDLLDAEVDVPEEADGAVPADERDADPATAVADPDGRDADGSGPGDVAVDGGVPSGDGPGSDLARTFSGASAACVGARDLTAVAACLADGAAAAAVGPAGRRLARFLSGAGAALRNADRVDGTRLALALEAGAEELAEADDGAHPGGLPAVSAAAADGALGAADAGSELAEVLVAAAESGLAELERGPLVDPGLAARGSVDATAAGFLLLLDALAAAVAGDPLPEPPSDEPVAEAADGERYRVACVVVPPEADPVAAADLEVVLHELSDQLAFSHRGRRWTVELVTAFPGATIEAMVGCGTPTELRITVVRPVPARG